MTKIMTVPQILCEDEAILAFDKPSGLLVAPDRWDKARENLMDIVHRRISPGYFNVHRLDKDTSGVLLCAKTKAALDNLCAQFEGRDVSKRYLAIVRGVPEWTDRTIDTALAADERRPGRMCAVRSGGMAAQTEFHVIEAWRSYALVEARPLTGRTHQIRVHLAAAGMPVVGDVFYGNGAGIMLSDLKKGYRKKEGPEKPLIGRLALHAGSLSFRHPTTGQPTTISAPLPDDFSLAIKYLGRFSGV